MAQLLLVRHGQARIDAPDYDQLSALGDAQAQALGAWLSASGQVPAAVYTGRLRRHAQTLAAMRVGGFEGPPEQPLAGLDEYPFQDLLSAYRQRHASCPALTAAETRGGRGDWIRLLEQVLLCWAEGSLDGLGAEAHADFLARIRDALAQVLGSNGLPAVVVTSGGVIAGILGQVLGLAAGQQVALNLAIRNASVTELAWRRGRLELVSFNSLPHLADASQAHLHTLV